MARAIQENVSLSELGLRGCRIGDTVAEGVGQALLAGSTEESKLELLDLSQNPISTRGVQRVLALINRMETTNLKRIILEASANNLLSPVL